MGAHSTRFSYRPIAVGLGLFLALGLAVTSVGERANATPGVIGDADFLGTAQSLAVLGGQTVTNTGPSVITGDLAVSPGLAVTGFPPGLVNGSTYAPPAAQAVTGQTDASNAFDALQAAGAQPVPTDLGGFKFGPGVYEGATGSGGALEINGTVVLDGSATDVFVFQSSSTLITGSASIVRLTGGAQACNVFWEVDSSATLGTNSVFAGTIIARTSITATTGASVTAGSGGGARLLALDGSVTLDSNVINAPASCATATGGTTAGTTPTALDSTDLSDAAADAAASLAAADAARAAQQATVDAAAAAAQAAADADRDRLQNTGRLLPNTGVDASGPLSIAVLSVLTGGLLIAVSRRQRVRSRVQAR